MQSQPAGRSAHVAALGVDPQLGGCKVFIPESSAMRGEGVDGEDIGANLIFRYYDGAETQQRLWDQRTGDFPCGAVVPDVNDVVGVSWGSEEPALAGIEAAGR